MWLFYFSWYIKNVVGLNTTETAMCVFFAQISSGISMLLIGLSSDKLETKWGKRKPWYVLGLFLCVPGFYGMFSYPEFINAKNNI